MIINLICAVQWHRKGWTLAILAIENETAENLDFRSIVTFVHAKARRMTFNFWILYIHETKKASDKKKEWTSKIVYKKSNLDI